VPLLIVALKVDQQIDVARRPGAGVLGAANDVHTGNGESFRIDLGGDLLRHLHPPPPVTLGFSLGFADRGLASLVVSFPGLGENGDGLVELRVHQDAEDTTAAGGRNVDNPDYLGEVFVLREHCRQEVGRCVEKAHVEKAVVVGIEGEVADLRLYEVLEEVGAEARVR